MQSLKQKIEGFGLSSLEIAEKTGIVVDKVEGIIQGLVDPTINELKKIAKALKVSPTLLTNNDKNVPALGILFRKSFTPNDASKISRLSFILNNCISLLNSYQPPNELLDKFPKVDNTFEGARELAQVFRKEFYRSDFVSPLFDLHTKVSRDLNCIVLNYELGNGADGASIIFNDIPFIIVCPRFPPRMLFTLAHELGHILSHHRERNFAVIDSYGAQNRRAQFEEEAFAHAFASELLMPQEGVGLALKSIRRHLKIEGDFIGEVELLYLSRIYGVSFEVAILRCENLGLVPIGTAISMYEQVSKAHKSPEARAKELGLPEREHIVFPKISSNLLDITIQEIQSGRLSIGKASEMLSLSAVEIINHNSNNE